MSTSPLYRSPGTDPDDPKLKGPPVEPSRGVPSAEDTPLISPERASHDHDRETYEPLTGSQWGNKKVTKPIYFFSDDDSNHVTDDNASSGAAHNATSDKGMSIFPEGAPYDPNREICEPLVSQPATTYNYGSPIDAASAPWNYGIPVGAPGSYPANATNSGMTNWWLQQHMRSGFNMIRDYQSLCRSKAYNDQKITFQRESEKIKKTASASMDVSGCEIFESQDGHLFFAVTDENDDRLTAKRLLGVTHFSATMLISYYLHQTVVLSLSWETGGLNKIVYLRPEVCDKAGDFLTVLRKNGLHFSVSGRGEKKAAHALIDYILSEAQTVEISSTHGWVLLGNGKWHFAGDDELTMREVLSYVNR